MVWKIFLAFTALYVFIAGFLYFYQKNLLYHPSQELFSLSVLELFEYQNVDIQTANNKSLKFLYLRATDSKKPTIVLFHGNAGNYTSRAFKAQAYAQEGYGVLLAGYRGYGGSSGDPSEQGLYKDARTQMDWLHDEKEIMAKNIILYGESLGTGVAVQMAHEYNVKALILEGAYSSITDIAKETYFWLPVDILLKDQYRSIDKIGSLGIPILFLHGARDITIPIAFAKKLYNAAPQSKFFVEFPGGGHSDLYDYGLSLHVLEFLSNIEAL